MRLFGVAQYGLDYTDDCNFVQILLFQPIFLPYIAAAGALKSVVWPLKA